MKKSTAFFPNRIFPAALIAGLFLINNPAFAQSGQKFATGGNTLSAGEFFGTLNNYPIDVKVNNTLRGSFTSTGLDIYGTAHSIHAVVDSILSSWQVMVSDALSVGGNLSVSGNAAITGTFTAGQITLNGSSITSSTGNIDLGNNNVSTTGTITGSNITSLANDVSGLQATTVNQQAEIDSLQSTVSNIQPSQWQNDSINPANIFYSSGNVGIGVSDPSEMFEVNGRVKISRSFEDSIPKDSLGNPLPPLVDSLGKPIPHPGPPHRSIIIDGGIDRITATSGTLDFDNTNLTTTGSFQSSSITTANLTIIDKIESDSMHARKSIEINNSLRLLRDTSVMYAEMSTKDTAVALMLQKDAASPVVIGDAPAPPPGGSRDKLTVLGNTKLDGHLSVTRDITSAGSINANCVTTSCLNVSGQTSFDSIKVTNKLQVGNNSVIISSIGTTLYPDNNIYSDNGDLLIQNQNSLNYNTIFNSNNTGNVGIGTTQPTEKLDISGNIRSSALAGTGSRLVTADASGVLTTQPITGSNNPYWSATGNSGTESDNFIGTTDESDLVIKTNNEERIRVTSAGEHPGLVGVGTNNPEKMLHIKTEHSFLEPPNPNCAGPFPPLECAQQSDGGGNSGSHNGIRLEDITSFTGGTTYNSKWDLVPAYGGLIFGRGDASGSDYDALIGTQPKVMIDQNGNVGIGTPPTKTLDVKGQGIRLENQVNSDLSVWDLEPIIDNNFNGVSNSLLNKLTIGKPTHPLMTFSSGDNGGLAAYAEGFGITLPLTDFIGIGTTNPLAKMDIYSDKDYGADASIRISNQHSVPAEDSPFNFGAGFNISLMYNYQNQLNGATIDNGDGGNLQITSKNNGIFIENINNIWRTSFNTDLTIGSQYSNKSLNVIGNTDISGNLKIKVSSADDIALAIYKEETEQFRITGNGVFYARGYKIKLGDFPDYVFNANYKPMTLAEKLDYIKKHGHLPYLPPANEIEKNGFDIGEGIVGITRNVEEIILSQNDLYKIIQAQQEQISLQQQQIDDLKKKLK